MPLLLPSQTYFANGQPIYAAASEAGVGSVNALTGALTVAGGQGIAVTESGQTITLALTGTPSGVTELNSLQGSLAVVAGTGVGVSVASPNISVANSGVLSLNSLSGATTLAAGTGITLTPAGQTITVAATGGVSGVPALTSCTYSGVTVSGGSTNPVAIGPGQAAFGDLGLSAQMVTDFTNGATGSYVVEWQAGWGLRDVGQGAVTLTLYGAGAATNYPLTDEPVFFANNSFIGTVGMYGNINLPINAVRAAIGPPYALTSGGTGYVFGYLNACNKAVYQQAYPLRFSSVYYPLGAQ